MITPTTTRRHFSSLWDQIEYLHDKAAYWLDYRKQRRNATPYVRRLKALIEKADPRHDTILGAACRALLADFDGNLADEIRFTVHKVKLLERWLNGAEERLDYNRGDVAHEYKVLAALYEENNQRVAASRAKEKSLQISKRSRSAGEATMHGRSKAS